MTAEGNRLRLRVRSHAPLANYEHVPRARARHLSPRTTGLETLTTVRCLAHSSTLALPVRRRRETRQREGCWTADRDGYVRAPAGEGLVKATAKVSASPYMQNDGQVD